VLGGDVNDSSHFLGGTWISLASKDCTAAKVCRRGVWWESSVEGRRSCLEVGFRRALDFQEGKIPMTSRLVE